MKKSFGQLLGELVYQKRKAIGLTQMQLAEDAFNTSGKTRRISELETGKVANPHPKTIDPIIVTLGISEREIEECASNSSSKRDENLERAYCEASVLIRKLAEDFEHSNPSATLEKLGAYLSAKALEYTVLKERIIKISETDESASKLQNEAAAALAEGKYSVVDDLLKKAEEIQQENLTLQQIREQAKIRILRGDNRFLEGDLEESFKLYEGAALFFQPFSQEEMVELFEELARRIYEKGRRSLVPSFWVSEKLLERALSESLDIISPEVHAGILYRLSLIYRNHASTIVSEDGANSILEKGIDSARKAVQIFGRFENQISLVSAQISLGNCLSDQTYLGGDHEYAGSAIAVFKDARNTVIALGKPNVLLGHIYNSLGAAILRNKAANDGTADIKTVKEAITAYRNAIDTSAEFGDLDVWGSAHINLARLIVEESKLNSVDEKLAAFVRIRAISYYLSAIETFPLATFPYPFAEAHFEMAEVLFTHGLHAESNLFEIYFSRAISSFFQASEVFSKEMHPMKWGHIQCRLGSVFGNHARTEGVESAKEDIERAISYFSEGKKAFENLEYKEGVSTCSKNIEHLSEDLDALNKTE